ncbi:hypothetical protein [Heyndrickxia oleronia]|uniref:hypothetical protein n=1 Tax=Heyndrickxia oleronia TaxID=38875 RepID=UPI001B20F0F0|nr:hypothetical protein [Heyndrickxia oleronia]GIN37823.1 hypothetical protein J19TS1_07720 [Heyndrickxia oleronia]
MNISVEIKAPELANAVLMLAKALEGNKLIGGVDFGSGQDQTVVTQPADTPMQQQSVPNSVPTAPVQQPPVQQQAPVQQQQQQTVPTTAPTYTMDQLAVAATQLVDANRRDELLQLLASFGVQALTQLPQEQYGAFATKLRELGAKI